MADMSNYARWMLEYARGASGFGTEFWGPLDDHPGRAEVLRKEAEVRKEQGLDPKVDSSTLTFLLTRSLVADVVDAAGAVEYSVGELDSLIGRAQATADREVVPHMDLNAWPEFGWSIADPASPTLDGPLPMSLQGPELSSSELTEGM